jgi:hypothetical protein
MPDAPALLTRDLSHVSTAWLELPAGEIVELKLEAGTVTFDEKTAPRVNADLTCQVPLDAGVLSRIDPRLGARLVVKAGYRRPGGLEDVQTLCDVGLRSRVVNRPGDTMRLVGESDEALVVDNAISSSLTVNTATTTAGIVYVLGLIFAAPTIVVTGPTGAAVNQTSLDADKWDTIADLADRIEARVYDNGLRTWIVEPAPVLASTPAIELKVGAGGTIIRSAAGVSRDDGFANRVLLVYEWRDAGGVSHRIQSVRSITSGDYAAVVGNVKTFDLRRDIPATQTQADAAATSLVKRTVTRGRSLPLEAVSAYWLRPGHTAGVQLPLGDAESHLISRVSFDLRTGLMAVDTRLPDNTGTIGA